MCARYELSDESERVQFRFELTTAPEFMPAPEIRPTNRVPVIAGNATGAGGAALMLRWGLIVDWNTKPQINARAETLEERKTFLPLLGARCLVPASAYFEWRKDGKAKIKTRIARRDGEIMAFAGLIKDDRFTIITCAPAPEIAHIHNRMPAILAPETEARWLDPGRPFGDLRGLLVPYPGALLDWAEIAPRPRQPDLF